MQVHMIYGQWNTNVLYSCLHKKLLKLTNIINQSVILED